MMKKPQALAVLVLLVAAGLPAKGFSHDPGERAAALADRTERVGNLYLLEPEPSRDTGYGLVFYPGGLVEPEAYLPLLDSLRQKGVMCVLVPMPMDLAVFAPRRGLKALARIGDRAEGRRWAIAGHSLGGVMAASLLDRASGSPFDALILLASYPAGSVDLSNAPIRALSIAASQDHVADREEISGGLERLPAETELIVIEGGNHAGFGDYGPQKGDGTATIPQERQWELTAEAIVDFLTGPDN